MNKSQFILSIAFLSVSIANGQITNLFPDNGNVGIGTTTPNSKLEVRDGGIRISNGTDRMYFGVDNNNSKSTIAFGDDTNDRLGFYFDYWNGTSNDKEVMSVMANGRVGIGTTAPYAPLEIRQKEDPNTDRGLLISEPNNSQKIKLHLASNINGEYGFLHLGGTTNLRGNGLHSSFDGSLGIGTTSPGSYKLAVKGKIRAEEIKVETGWADYVFQEDYELPTLEEVEKHIKDKGHLINIPSAQEVEKNGVQLGEMNKLLLEKIEELTLYVISLNKQNQKLLKVLQQQDTKIQKLQENVFRN